MKEMRTKKLCVAGIFVAVAVVGSLFGFPVFGSKCAPIQHMVNILCAVMLGPFYGVSVAFCASVIRNLLGLGSLMAFPGSMLGALLCGIVFHKKQKYSIDSDRRGFWHRYSGWSVRLPHCHSVYGDAGWGNCFLCLYHPVFDFYCRRRCDFRCAAGGIEKYGCTWNIQINKGGRTDV